MSSHKCNLIFTGRFVDGIDQETIYQNLAGLFKTDVDKVKAKFTPENTVIIKKGADQELCTKMQAAIHNAGAVCEVKQIADEMEASAEDKSMPLEEKAAAPEKTGDVNPYSAPKSNIQVNKSTDGSSFNGPHAVPAGNGFTWIATGFSLFFKHPFRWILATLLYFLCNIIQIIPIIGPLVMMFINPIFMAGYFHGAKELDDDGIAPGATCIFKGFSQNAGSLFLLGLSILGVAIVMAIGMVLIMMVGMGVGFSDFGNPQAMQNISPMAVALPVLIMLLLIFPIMMCYWFAIPLVGLNGMNVFESFGVSFRACLKNILPFLIYSLIGIGIYIVLMVVLALLIPQLATDPGAGAVVVTLVFTVIFLCLMPIGIISMYASYKDIFYGNQA